MGCALCIKGVSTGPMLTAPSIGPAAPLDDVRLRPGVSGFAVTGRDRIRTGFNDKCGVVSEICRHVNLKELPGPNGGVHVWCTEMTGSCGVMDSKALGTAIGGYVTAGETDCNVVGGHKGSSGQNIDIQIFNHKGFQGAV